MEEKGKGGVSVERKEAPSEEIGMKASEERAVAWRHEKELTVSDPLGVPPDEGGPKLANQGRASLKQGAKERGGGPGEKSEESRGLPPPPLCVCLGGRAPGRRMVSCSPKRQTCPPPLSPVSLLLHSH